MSDQTPAPPPPKQARPPSRSTRAARRNLWLAAAAGAALALLGIWLVVAWLPRFLTTPAGGGEGQGASGAAGEARRIHATLFYVADSGTELVPVNAEVPYGATTLDQARRIVEAQIQPPAGELSSAIPAATKVRGVYLTPRGEAYVDLSPDVVSGHTGGSLDEALAVFAIVNALTVNLPDVSAVQILVNGKEVDTLVGHIDLRHPLKRSLEWVRR